MRKEEEDIRGNVTKNVPVYQNSKGRAGYCLTMMLCFSQEQ